MAVEMGGLNVIFELEQEQSTSPYSRVHLCHILPSPDADVNFGEASSLLSNHQRRR